MGSMLVFVRDTSLCVLLFVWTLGEVLGVSEAVYLLSPLEVVDRTDPGRDKELNSTATPVTMIWLVRGTLHSVI